MTHNENFSKICKERIPCECGISPLFGRCSLFRNKNVKINRFLNRKTTFSLEVSAIPEYSLKFLHCFYFILRRKLFMKMRIFLLLKSIKSKKKKERIKFAFTIIFSHNKKIQMHVKRNGIIWNFHTMNWRNFGTNFSVLLHVHSISIFVFY